MIVHNFEQNSPEWFNARIGIPTASEFKKIITSKGDESKTLPKYALELATQQLLTVQDESYTNADMERGSLLEQEAREEYEALNLVNVEPVGFVTDDNNSYGASPDGLIGDDGILEIKCPRSTTQTERLVKGFPKTDYYAQVQGQLLVTERKWCDFVSYHPNFTNINHRLLVWRIERDEDFITKLQILLNKISLSIFEILENVERD